MAFIIFKFGWGVHVPTFLVYTIDLPTSKALK